ncbi:V-type ATP synthase subunit F [Candidatus Margulisiibacteriota bacterium]
MAAIGPKNLFGGFKALGVEVFHVERPEDATEILEKVSRTKEYAIIFLMERFAASMQDIVDRISSQVSPSLVILPGTGERLGHGVDRISALVRKAAGQDIL